MDEYWTIRQAADRLQVHERTIRRWIADGRLAALRIARTVRVPRRTVEEIAGAEPHTKSMDAFVESILEWQRQHQGRPLGTDSGEIVREWRDGKWDEW